MISETCLLPVEQNHSKEGDSGPVTLHGSLFIAIYCCWGIFRMPNTVAKSVYQRDHSCAHWPFEGSSLSILCSQGLMGDWNFRMIDHLIIPGE